MSGPPPATQGWARSRTMTAFEVIMWRVEADPRMRSTFLIAEILDRAPDRERFTAAHEWASRMAPRFRDHVVTPLLGLGTPYWAASPDFDLHYHLRWLRLGGDGDWSELWSVAEQLAMTPLDPARPLWEATIVEGLPGGRAAYLLKMHHVVTDGIGLAQLLSDLHSRTREHTADKPQPPAPEAEPDSVLTQLGRQLRDDATGLASTAVDAGRAVVSALRHPVDSVTGSRDYLASARRVLSPPEAAGSPLLAARSGASRFRAVDVVFADLRAAGKSVGATVNDAYLAALLGGYRLYHERSGHPVDPDALMPISVPVSVRRADDSGGGNRFAPGRLSGPLGVVDPADRVRAVSAGMARTKSEPALESADLVFPLVARLPGEVVAGVAGDATKANDLQASNIPGLREEVFLAGARIDRLYPFGPLPGCGAMITMTSHGTTCCVAANVDAASVTDMDLFERCLVDGFTEVLSLVADAAAPVARSGP